MEKLKDYGFVSNYLYALKMTAKGSKKMLIAIIVSGVFTIMAQMLGIYMPKIILSMIENQSELKDFIISILILGFAMIMFDFILTCAWQLFDIEDVKNDAYLEDLRMKKIYETDFKNMENPDFLDLVHRAKAALYKGMGFHGMLQQSRNFISQGAMTIITAVLIGVENVFIMISIFLASFIVAKILSYTSKVDKEKFTDFMAPTFRKIKYLDNTSKNFDFAKDLRLFKMSGIFSKEYSKLNSFFNRMNKIHHNRWFLCNMGMETFRFIQKTLMYVWLVYAVIFQNMSLSDFVLYIGLATRFNEAIGYISWVYSNLRQNSLMVNDYRNFVGWEEDVETKAEDEGIITDIDLNGYEFKFENVSFKYPGHDYYVLKNINLTINDGMKLAIVGVNGAGKTTFVKLIMKLYEPTEGRILLNGIDIKQYDRESYFKIFSPVFQNVECFALPIYQNVSFEDEEHTDFNKVNKSLEQSGLLEKINSYENGVHTNLLKIFDEKGIDLSGGEKQRLAMARALYKGGSVVILDEPTAALDALAEDRMYREFENMVSAKTSIFISHRLGSTQFCDKVAMFEDGKIVEEGTHEELMKMNGKYAYMYNIQSQYYKGGQENENI